MSAETPPINSFTHYPIIYAFRAFALESHIDGRPHISRLLLGYSVLTILLNLQAAHYVFFSVSLFGTATVLDIVSAMLAIGLFASHLCCTLHSIWQRRQFAQMLAALGWLDDELRAEFNWDIRRKWMGLKYAATMALFDAMMASTTAFYYLAIRSWQIALVVMFISLVTRMRCVQIVFYVHQLERRMRVLNDMMRGKNVDHDQRGKDTECTRNPTHNLAACAKSGQHLRALCRMFDGCWDISNVMNDCFGLSLLAVTADAFLVVVIDSFLICSVGFVRALYGMLPTLVSFTMVCWMADQLEQTVRRCERKVYHRQEGSHCNVTTQYAETVELAGRTVFKRSAEEEEELGEDDDHRNGLEMASLRQSFQLQVAHQRIRLHVCGIFELNLKLVASIWAVTISYLIVLLQFSG